MKAAGVKALRLASAETIKKLTGAEIGYAGLINLPDSIEVYLDESVSDRTNFETGANKTNFHAVNVNFDRDIPLPKKFTI